MPGARKAVEYPKNETMDEKDSASEVFKIFQESWNVLKGILQDFPGRQTVMPFLAGIENHPDKDLDCEQSENDLSICCGDEI